MIIKQNFYLTLLLLIVMSSCGNKMSKRQKTEVVIAKARSYTGTPYKWGGTSSKGMDCSGLLLNSFKAVDIEIPRTSAEQKKTGKKVSRSDIKKGDLVFFATSKKKRKVTHVGLVTKVQGTKITFIHSSTSKGVTESSLDNSYWNKRYRQARRIL
jgi:cell wall-associated NlpC family hydrolase